MWPHLPPAAAILADCAASPPRKAPRVDGNITREQYDRTDMRVRIIHRLQREAFEALLAAYDLTRTPEALEALKSCPSVEAAIDEAVAGDARRAA